jgi:hypothetical protein
MVVLVQIIRNFVRFWFGIQAWGLVISACSLTLVLLVPQKFHSFDINRTVYGPLIGTTLLMAVFDGASAVAWWTLRKGKPSARGWAIAASVLNLPIPAFSHLRASNVAANLLHVPDVLVGSLIAVAGLVAFLPKNALLGKTARARAPKPVRIAGDGTSKLKDHLSQLTAIAIVWVSLAWWGQWASAHQLAYPNLLPFFFQMELAILLTTFGHELGHLVAGWASGKMLRSFQVGPVRWAIRNGGWKFDFNLRKFYGGSVGMVAPDLRNMRSRQAFLLMGGPVASLVMGSLFVVVAMLAPGHSWQSYWMFFSMLATFSLSAFVVNLIPIKPESLYSDGAQLYQIVTNGPWARVHFAFAMVTTSLVAPVRPRDFDINVIREAANSVPLGERGLLLRLFACMHYLDSGRIAEGIASMEEAEALYAQSIFEKPQDICAEFVFVNAFYKRDLAAAEMWSRRIEDLRKVDLDADYWRAQSALHWLKSEYKEAREAWERGYALAEKLPSAGTYDYTRTCLEQLRAALHTPMPEGPPTVESLLALAAVCEHSRVAVEA